LLRLRSGRSWYTDLRALVTALWEIAPDAQLLIAGLPPVYLSPVLSAPFGWLVGRRAQTFDQQSVRLARETGAAVEVISHRDPLITPAFFAADRFHPSPHAYQAWARYLAAGITGVISASFEGRLQECP
jgi:lysophospholipase L1-like esterase